MIYEIKTDECLAAIENMVKKLAKDGHIDSALTKKITDDLSGMVSHYGGELYGIDGVMVVINGINEGLIEADAKSKVLRMLKGRCDAGTRIVPAGVIVATIKFASAKKANHEGIMTRIDAALKIMVIE